MFARLLLLFIVVPLVELALLLRLADATSWWFTLALVIVTGVVGSWLARSQGFRTYQRIHRELSAGQMPTVTLLDALMIFVAGALLLTPGILTDIFGLSLLVPAARRLYRRRMVNWIKRHFRVQTYSHPHSPPQRSEVIDSHVVDRSPDSD